MNLRVLAVAALLACGPKSVLEPPGGEETDTPQTGTSGTGTTGTGTGTGGTTSDTPLEIAILDSSWVTEVGQFASVRASVTSPEPEPISVVFRSDLDGVLGSATPDGADEVVLQSDVLSPGWHEIAVEATQGSYVETETSLIGVCEWPGLEDFATGASINGWTLFGNAAWDPGGWLEVTGNITSSDGAIFKVDRKVNAGDVAIEFEIATGGGINTGADGFAVSVIDAYDEAELASIVNLAGLGGCLGYGTDGGVCGTTAINAFHIEFDTWYNYELADPTTENHVAVALNGDPTPILWAAIPSLEDLVWRHVRVEIAGSNVTVLIDGSQVMQGALPGFTFDGGYIGVSGSTGAATNYHRFDNLQLYDICQVPDATTTSSTP